MNHCKLLQFILFIVFLSSYFIQMVLCRHSKSHHYDDIDCYRCPPGYGVYQKCNKYHDTECIPCQIGYYSAHHSAHRKCFPCSRCGLGLYIAHHCTTTKDTVCDSCHTYKGPHNKDYYNKCVIPQFSGTMEPAALVSKPSPKTDASIHITVIVAAVTASAVLSAVLITYCIVRFRNRKQHKRNAKFLYPYEAVATQEAVML